MVSESAEAPPQRGARMEEVTTTRAMQRPRGGPCIDAVAEGGDVHASGGG